MNGYFRLVSTQTSTEMEIFAPTEGGESVNGSEIVAYLASKGITYDATRLNSALDRAQTQNVTVILNMSPIKPIAELCIVKMSPDKLKAYVRLYAPSKDGTRMDSRDILTSIKTAGVSEGIMEDSVQKLVDSPRYCEDILIAEGIQPEDSQDGYIEYLFNTDRNQRPTQNPDGSVDFFHLNLIQGCAKGQAIARMHPAVRGADGRNVEGNIIKAREPKEAKFQYGNNIYISEDGLSLLSKVDGNATLLGEQIFVNDSLTFDEIGTATGNIDFEGSIVINGNIDTNFEVCVKGDVVVNGVIEGARVEAGGNIVVAKGVNGMGKAVLKAGGNIVAKYMENVEATAGGYIRAESIMHSNVSAGSDIIVDGKKGMLSGGKATAGGMVEVKNLGSEMANDTIVEVGMSPAIKREILSLRNQAAEKQKTIDQIKPVLANLAGNIRKGLTLTNEQKLYASKLMNAQRATDEELAGIMVRLAELEAKYNPDTEAEVRVKGMVYPGTKVCILDVSMSVKSATKYCKFVRLRGDVKITSYE